MKKKILTLIIFSLIPLLAFSQRRKDPSTQLHKAPDSRYILLSDSERNLDYAQLDTFSITDPITVGDTTFQPGASTLADVVAYVASNNTGDNISNSNLTSDSDYVWTLNGRSWRVEHAPGMLIMSFDNSDNDVTFGDDVGANGNIGAQGYLYVSSDDNKRIKFNAQEGMTANDTEYFFGEDGNVNQVQTTDGNGNLSWRNATIVVDSFQQIQNINAEVGQYIYSVEQDAYYTVSQDSFLRPLDNIYQFQTSEGDFVNIVPKDGKLTARSYGIVGDVKQVSAAGTNIGNVLTSSVPVFTSNDIGKIINIDGAYHQGTYQTETLTFTGTSTADQTISFDYIDIDVDILNGDIVDTVAAKVQRAIDESEYYTATRNASAVTITYTKMYPERFVSDGAYTGGTYNNSNTTRGVARKTFSTTIASVNSSTQVTLTNTPYLDVDDTNFEFGTNQTEKSKLFIDYCAKYGYISQFDEGIYYFSEHSDNLSYIIKIDKDESVIQGAGIGKTIFKFSSPTSMILSPDVGSDDWIIADTSYYTAGTAHEQGGRRYLRMFNISGTKKIQISNLTFDGFNEVVKYRAVGGNNWINESSLAQDAQQYFIQSNNDASYCKYKNLEIINICGDAISISGGKETEIKYILINDFLRQGVGVGGTDTEKVFIQDLFKNPNQKIMKNGGTDFHSEPATYTKNVFLQNVHIDKGTVSGSKDAYLVNVTAETFIANTIDKATFNSCTFDTLSCAGMPKKFNLTASTIGHLVASSTEDSLDLSVLQSEIESININKVRNISLLETKVNQNWDDSGVANNITIKSCEMKGFSWSSASGKSTNISIYDSYLTYVKVTASGKTAILNNEIDASSNSEVSSILCSQLDGVVTIRNNKILGAEDGMYIYNTSNYSKFKYPAYIFNNEIDINGTGEHIRINKVQYNIRNNSYSRAGIVSESDIEVLSPVGHEYKITEEGRHKYIRSANLPLSGLYNVGNISYTNDGVYIAIQGGAAYKEAWNLLNTYYINEYTLGSNSRVYRCVQYNGNAEDPTLDVDDSHWAEVATDTVVWEKIITDSDKIQYQSNATAAQTVIDVGQSFNPNKSTWTLKVNGLEYNEGLTNSQISSYDAAAGTITLFSGLAADDTIIFRGQSN